ncbi:type II secretion system protein [Candidatus Symbiobacter mobilis]|uniref:Type II secretory pathway protein n=1 Tax=Candidatus Symbiobacter mobilis CR TaxID=946483 RepID=U5ND47_9BURK|nr:type II secretion system protein [Candidatus Symbiobacter mobilis]AGX88168.1 type II secretory pathway protein [Candidatus Symbiobacter mobilis CR]
MPIGKSWARCARQGWGAQQGSGQRGFGYVGLLLAVAFFGLASVGAARMMAASERAQQEADLLFIGHQFRAALRSYVASGSGGYPATLEDLLLDRRFPTVRRHLRRIYVDPLRGVAEWGTIPAPEGGIMGIYSLSERPPRKTAGFDPEDADIAITARMPRSDDAPPLTYRDWHFVYRPGMPDSSSSIAAPP